MDLGNEFMSFFARIVGKYSPDVLVPIEHKGLAVTRYVESRRPGIFNGIRISPARIHHEEIYYFDPSHWRGAKALIFDDSVFSGRTMCTAKEVCSRYASTVRTAAFWVCSQSKGQIQVDSAKHRWRKDRVLQQYYSYHLWLRHFNLPAVNDNPTIDVSLVPPPRGRVIARVLGSLGFTAPLSWGATLLQEGMLEKIFERGRGPRYEAYLVGTHYEPSGRLRFCISRYADGHSRMDSEWLDFIGKEISSTVVQLRRLILRYHIRVKLADIDLVGMSRRSSRPIEERKKRLRRRLEQASGAT